MPKLRVHAFGISLDGYGASPNQDLENSSSGEPGLITTGEAGGVRIRTFLLKATLFGRR